MKSSWKKSWLVVGQLTGLYLFILAVAALLTPAVAALLKLGGWSFAEAKVFDRLRWVGVLLSLPFLWRWAGLKGWKDLGWKDARGAAVWMLAGAASVCAVGVWIGQGGTLAQPLKLEQILGLALKGLAVGVAVSLLEEVVFRGILQRIWVKAAGKTVGILLGAMVFAWLHGRPPATGNSWQHAWAYVSQWPENFPLLMWVNLTLLGWALGWMYEARRSLWWPVGLHAGLVAAMLPMMSILGQMVPSLGRVELMTHPAVSVLLSVWAAVAWRLGRPGSSNA